MRMKELLTGRTLAEDVGPGRDWDPHSMGAPGAVPPFVPGNRGVPNPPGTNIPSPMAMPGKAADVSGVGPGRDWDPHSMGAPGAVPPFVPGNRAPGQAPAPVPMQQPMAPGKVAMGGGPGPMAPGPTAPMQQQPKMA
jgi:hypothetical protein